MEYHKKRAMHINHFGDLGVWERGFANEYYFGFPRKNLGKVYNQFLTIF
jgi:hypothetical protein